MKMKKIWQIISWATAGIWLAALFLMSRTGFNSAHFATGVFGGFTKTVTPGWQKTIDDWAPTVIPFLGFMLLAFLAWLSLRLSGIGRRSSVALSFAIVLLFTVVEAIFRLLRIGDSGFFWVVELLGGLVLLLGVTLYEIAGRKFPKIVNPETLNYIIFGVLTTVLNYGVFFWLDGKLGMYYLLANAIAWVAGVLFAFVTNKLVVFRSRHTGAELLREGGLFVAARLFSLGAESVLMALFVEAIRLSNGVSKIICGVVVLVMNYFFSKWIIFKKKPPETSEEEGPEVGEEQYDL